MPHPSRRQDPTPGDLARDIARRLAESAPVQQKFSLRDSVLVGRVIAGSIVLAVTGLVLIGLITGANWLVSRSAAETPSVLAGALIGDEDHQPTQPGGTMPDDQSGVFFAATTTTIGLGPVVGTEPGSASSLPSLPSPTTTVPDATVDPTTTLVTTTTHATTTSSQPSGAPTTQPTTTTSSPLPPTTLPPTTSTTSPTTSSTTSTTTTTTTQPPSTTTTEPTTTTVAPTTTTTEPTTTTCGNQGGGGGGGTCNAPTPP